MKTSWSTKSIWLILANLPFDCLNGTLIIPISDGRKEQTITRASWTGWAKVTTDHEKGWNSAWSRGWTGSENCSFNKGTALNTYGQPTCISRNNCLSKWSLKLPISGYVKHTLRSFLSLFINILFPCSIYPT